MNLMLIGAQYITIRQKEIWYFSEEINIKHCIDFLHTDWNFSDDSVQLNFVGGGKARTKWEREGGKVMVTNNCCHLLSTYSVQGITWTDL